MGRIAIQTSTKKIIEYQSSAAVLGTLTQNAINSGYATNDIDEHYITDAEYTILLASLPPPPPPPEPLKDEIAALTAQDLTNIAKMKGILEQLRIGKMIL